MFGFGKKKVEEEEEQPDVDPIQFKGPIGGKEPNLAAHGRLMEAGLIPAKDMMTDALLRRAGTIRLEPKGEQASITLLIDGMPYPGGRLGKQTASAVTQILKLLAGLDIKQRQTPQSGGLKAEFEDRPYELLISTTPTPAGERLTVRATDMKIKLESPEELGFSEEFRKKVRERAVLPGLFLVAGPAASGTSTTLYGCLRAVDAYMYSIYTVGPQEKTIFNVTPFPANEGEKLQTTLQRCVRAEANLIGIAQMKNTETLQAALSVSETVSIMAEMSAKDTPSAVQQLIKWAGDPQVIADRVTTIVSQKLIRKLCEQCRQPFRPSSDFLKKAGLPASVTTLYRKPKPVEGVVPDACDKCGDLGFYGRAAMFEMLEFSDEMKQLVATNPDPAKIRTQMRKEQMLTLQKDGLRLIAEGKTSLEEVQRVFKTP